jgi:HEAT repeat protein
MRDIESAGAVPVLGAGLSDRDVCVRRVAARLMGRVTHPDAQKSLLRQLSGGEDHSRQMAAIGLGYSGSRASVEALIESLGDRDAGVRSAAAWALGEIEDSRAIEPLTRALAEDPDPAVRSQAARALGEIG